MSQIKRLNWPKVMRPTLVFVDVNVGVVVGVAIGVMGLRRTSRFGPVSKLETPSNEIDS